ncbi:hypothetical protein EDB87DRAFT_1752156 [Lactarius vividus]|nr:hypothetical protein EDB87DRAFT_1752156 [Lactarius vividus]
MESEVCQEVKRRETRMTYGYNVVERNRCRPEGGSVDKKNGREIRNTEAQTEPLLDTGMGDLHHAPLWTSITGGLSLRWIKVFIERSQTMLMDFDTEITPRDQQAVVDKSLGPRSQRYYPTSLRFHASRLPLPYRKSAYYPPRFATCSSPRIAKLSRHTGSSAVSPVFTSTESIPSFELLDVLRQMSALTHFEFHPLAFLWGNLDLDKLRASSVHMPQLESLIVHPGNFLKPFTLLNQSLLLNAGAKRRLELHLPEFCDWIGHEEAADGFRHIHFSGEQKEGRFRLWTGNAGTAWEDAEFCLFAEWRPFGGANTSGGVAQARKLVIDLPSPHPEKFSYTKKDLSESYWWELLEKLPGIEELELRSTVEGKIAGAWEVSVAPALLPAMRRVRIVAPRLDLPSPEYIIIGAVPGGAICGEGDRDRVKRVASVVAKLSRVTGDVGMFWNLHRMRVSHTAKVSRLGWATGEGYDAYLAGAAEVVDHPAYRSTNLTTEAWKVRMHGKIVPARRTRGKLLSDEGPLELVIKPQPLPDLVQGALTSDIIDRVYSYRVLDITI